MSDNVLKAFRIKGTTDDVTQCQQCGRDDLKMTVVLDVLDAEGNACDVTYVGTDCAATMTKWTQREVKAQISAAKRAAREEAERQREIARQDDERAFVAWANTTYGISATSRADVWKALPGMSGFQIRKRYDQEKKATQMRPNWLDMPAGNFTGHGKQTGIDLGADDGYGTMDILAAVAEVDAAPAAAPTGIGAADQMPLFGDEQLMIGGA